jgi:hypothetical protein
MEVGPSIGGNEIDDVIHSRSPQTGVDIEAAGRQKGPHEDYRNASLPGRVLHHLRG